MAETGLSSLYSGYYDKIGAPILFSPADPGLTPSTFRLGVEWVSLQGARINLWPYYYPETAPLDPLKEVHADFATSLDSSPIGFIDSGSHADYLSARFRGHYCVLSLTNGSGTYSIEYRPSIVVTIPGYTATDWPDVYAVYPYNTDIIWLDSGNEPVYERRCIDSAKGIFEFSFDFLQPRMLVMADGSIKPAPLKTVEGKPAWLYSTTAYAGDAEAGSLVMPLAGFDFLTSCTGPEATIVGAAGEPTWSNVGQWDPYTHVMGGSDCSMILQPYAGLDVPDDADGVDIEIALDITGIVRVYDNDTPADKTDDIAVLAPNFWERLTAGAVFR